MISRVPTSSQAILQFRCVFGVHNGMNLFLKLLQNKKDLNDVTSAPFSVSFSQLPAAEKRVVREVV